MTAESVKGVDSVLVCPRCGTGDRVVFPRNKSSQLDPTAQIELVCGHISSRLDILIEANGFDRLWAVSTGGEIGKARLRVGQVHLVAFSAPLELVGLVTCNPRMDCYARPLLVGTGGFSIITSVPPEADIPSHAVDISYFALGIRKVADVEEWWLRLHDAVHGAFEFRYKSAFLDYAVTFEMFVETYLYERLCSDMNTERAEIILKKFKGIEERAKDGLKLATGHSLTEDPGVYSAWQKHVQQPRNALMHGARVVIGQEEAEAAHQAVCRAIQWILMVA
jgi:hypothetical protein